MMVVQLRAILHWHLALWRGVSGAAYGGSWLLLSDRHRGGV